MADQARELGFTSRRYLRLAIKRHRLVKVPVKGMYCRRTAAVSYRKDCFLSPAAQRFIEIVKTMAKEIAAEKP